VKRFVPGDHPFSAKIIGSWRHPLMMSVALAEDGSCQYDASCPGERRAAVAGTTQHRCWFVWPGNGDRAIVCYHRRRLARQPQKAYMRERKAGMNVKLMCWKRTGTYDENLLWCIYCPTTFGCGSKNDEDFILFWFRRPGVEYYSTHCEQNRQYICIYILNRSFDFKSICNKLLENVCLTTQDP